MIKSKLERVVLSGFILMFSLLIASSISEARSKESMVGLISFSMESNAVIGMITTANRGMEKIISYQIPQLTGDGPYTFYAPYSLAVTSDKDSSQTSSILSRDEDFHDNRMDNGGASDDMMGEENDNSDDMDNGHKEDSGNMMDDENDSGRMTGEWSNMRWSYDTYITLSNTSGISVAVSATFYDNNGNVVKETTFNLAAHQTIQESVFEILGLR